MDGSIQSWKRWFQQMKYRDEQVYKYSDDEYEDDDEDYEEEEDEDEEDDLNTYAQIPNSVYTLSLNSAGRLFAGGGPFLVSAKGCYIGLW
ncbi:MAG: hypothetical protein EZS28_001122 [Streblomastix strix]|uniref:Uncharacterized protein n=1 Tax=Streblomastix strix TaxID=222440 RepID=A0A5J4X8Y2_9EUKA|nr:MAG: hypothetical protein EZS28_001121 [Streblomastix strix]KAA6403352.1 MAG: hypothetical protein EZS28_001122 [Streblomastix strix]